MSSDHVSPDQALQDFEGAATRIVCHLEGLLARRGKTLSQLAREVDISIVNLSKLKNGHARAIRFSTLIALCQALDCQPGDLLGME